jgi:tRNA(Met) C34 N-acetyltransferase TmcA
MKRLELYGNNMADYHLVTDLLPSLARLYFLFGLNNEVHLSALQQAILLGIGLQVDLGLVKLYRRYRLIVSLITSIRSSSRVF